MTRGKWFMLVVGAVVALFITAMLASCEREPFGPPSPAPCISAK